MVIEQNGLPCPCGRHGCWEQYASATALKRMTAEAAGGPTPDSILARVITGRMTDTCRAVGVYRGPRG